MGSEQPGSPAGPSRASTRSYDQFEEEAPMLPRVPVGSRRLSGSRRGPTTSTGLGLWSAITLPVRLIMGILSGTWYFLSEYPYFTFGGHVRQGKEGKYQCSVKGTTANADMYQYQRSCRSRSYAICPVSYSHLHQYLPPDHLGIQRPRLSRSYAIWNILRDVQQLPAPCPSSGSVPTASTSRT